LVSTFRIVLAHVAMGLNNQRIDTVYFATDRGEI
jgi:hypothetical protein